MTLQSSINAAYQVGTWTPTLSFGGGTTGITYGTQTGVYARLGDIIYCSFSIVLTNKGSSTGTATIGTLPFTSVSGITQGGPLGYTSLVNYPGGPPANNSTSLGYTIASSATSMTLQQMPITKDGAASTVMDDQYFDNTSTVQCSFVYRSS